MHASAGSISLVARMPHTTVPVCSLLLLLWLKEQPLLREALSLDGPM